MYIYYIVLHFDPTGITCGTGYQTLQHFTGTGLPCKSGAPGCAAYAMTVEFCDSDSFAGKPYWGGGGGPLKDVSGREIQPLTGDQRKCCLAMQLQTPSPFVGRFSVQAFDSESTADSMSVWNPQCKDVLGPYMGGQPMPYNNLLVSSLADAAALSCSPTNASLTRCPAGAEVCVSGECVPALCANIAAYCHEDSPVGVRARQFCSITCGCSDPFSRLMLAGAGVCVCVCV